jgi:hypothetical protein
VFVPTGRMALAFKHMTSTLLVVVLAGGESDSQARTWDPLMKAQLRQLQPKEVRGAGTDVEIGLTAQALGLASHALGLASVAPPSLAPLVTRSRTSNILSAVPRQIFPRLLISAHGRKRYRSRESEIVARHSLALRPRGREPVNGVGGAIWR